MRDSERVVIVAAGTAWPFYRISGGYVCQPGRTFQDAGRMGFYSSRQIHGAAARIEGILPSIELTSSEAARRSLSIDPMERRIGDIMTAALADAWDESTVEVVVLSPFRAQDTLKFEPVIHHGAHAWTQNQRYAQVAALMSARTTEDLAELVTDEPEVGS